MPTGSKSDARGGAESKGRSGTGASRGGNAASTGRLNDRGKASESNSKSASRGGAVAKSGPAEARGAFSRGGAVSRPEGAFAKQAGIASQARLDSREMSALLSGFARPGETVDVTGLNRADSRPGGRFASTARQERDAPSRTATAVDHRGPLLSGAGGLAMRASPTLSTRTSYGALDEPGAWMDNQTFRGLSAAADPYGEGAMRARNGYAPGVGVDAQSDRVNPGVAGFSLGSSSDDMAAAESSDAANRSAAPGRIGAMSPKTYSGPDIAFDPADTVGTFSAGPPSFANASFAPSSSVSTARLAGPALVGNAGALVASRAPVSSPVAGVYSDPWSGLAATDPSATLASLAGLREQASAPSAPPDLSLTRSVDAQLAALDRAGWSPAAQASADQAAADRAMAGITSGATSAINASPTFDPGQYRAGWDAAAQIEADVARVAAEAAARNSAMVNGAMAGLPSISTHHSLPGGFNPNAAPVAVASTHHMVPNGLTSVAALPTSVDVPNYPEIPNSSPIASAPTVSVKNDWSPTVTGSPSLPAGAFNVASGPSGIGLRDVTPGKPASAAPSAPSAGSGSGLSSDFFAGRTGALESEEMADPEADKTKADDPFLAWINGRRLMRETADNADKPARWNGGLYDWS